MRSSGRSTPASRRARQAPRMANLEMKGPIRRRARRSTKPSSASVSARRNPGSPPPASAAAASVSGRIVGEGATERFHAETADDTDAPYRDPRAHRSAFPRTRTALLPPKASESEIGNAAMSFTSGGRRCRVYVGVGLREAAAGRDAPGLEAGHRESGLDRPGGAEGVTGVTLGGQERCLREQVVNHPSLDPVVVGGAGAVGVDERHLARDDSRGREGFGEGLTQSPPVRMRGRQMVGVTGASRSQALGPASGHREPPPLTDARAPAPRPPRRD